MVATTGVVVTVVVVPTGVVGAVVEITARAVGVVVVVTTGDTTVFTVGLTLGGATTGLTTIVLGALNLEDMIGTVATGLLSTSASFFITTTGLAVGLVITGTRPSDVAGITPFTTTLLGALVVVGTLLLTTVVVTFFGTVYNDKHTCFFLFIFTMFSCFITLSTGFVALFTGTIGFVIGIKIGFPFGPGFLY